MARNEWNERWIIERQGSKEERREEMKKGKEKLNGKEGKMEKLKEGMWKGKNEEKNQCYLILSGRDHNVARIIWSW